jgi:hypothetical protein
MQGMSEAVSEGRAKLGDVLKSTTLEVLATKDSAIEILPISAEESWVLSEKVGNKFEFRGVVPMSLENRSAELEFTKDGTMWRRDKSLDFYVLLKKDIAKEFQAMEKIKAGEFADPDDCLLPVLVSFRRTSFRAGKDIATHIAKTSHFKMPPFAKSLKLSSQIEKNDQGTFAVFKIESGVMSTKEEVAVCDNWYHTITKAKPKVHEPEADAPTEAKVVDEASAKF